MLFDEATASLDPELTGEVLGVMRELAGRRDDDGDRHARDRLRRRRSDGRIAFLDHGRVLMSGGPQEVFGKPRHPRIEQFLDTYLDRGAAMLV